MATYRLLEIMSIVCRWSRRHSCLALWAFAVVLMPSSNPKAFVVVRQQGRQRTRSKVSKLPLASQWRLDDEGTNVTGSSSNGITLKLAFDQQWGVAELGNKTSERFTSPLSLDRVHRLRKDCQAVLVGKNTVVVDNCSLIVRRGISIPDHEQPMRIILDPSKSLQHSKYKDFQIFSDGYPTVIYYLDSKLAKDAPPTMDHQGNVTWVGMPRNHHASRLDKLNVTDIWQHLQTAFYIQHLLVEGGPTTAHAFLQDGLVDRAILVQAPMNFSRPAPSNMTLSTFEEASLTILHTIDDEDGGDTTFFLSRSGTLWPGTEENANGSATLWP